MDELAHLVREARFNRNNRETRILLQILRLSTESWKELLITAEGERRIQLQGSIQDVRDILSQIEGDVGAVNHALDGAYLPE